ncbi:GspE/PulE family protein [Chitinilyticum litopenaei]|uniref:GspE/PulE family protein n=1 Tax=Chitinilyticum litopenaei TaxID=1121276 RepID=UPI000424E23A|nr:GspE/PulE family protein [Chitinilyticum litopenaei]
MTTANLPRLRLGALLVGKGDITEDQLRIALLEQPGSGLPLGRLLVRLGFLDEAALRVALAAQLGCASIELARVVPDPQALALLGKDAARRLLTLPLALDRPARRWRLAMVNPNDLQALDQLRALSQGCEIEVLLAGEAELLQGIERSYGCELAIDGILQEIETGASAPATATGGYGEALQPVVRLIDALLADAVLRGASDVHFEPEEHFVRIRYRIDGLLQQVRALHRSFWPAMVVRLKVLAALDIAETRLAQDGRLSRTLNGHETDFRVASQPTLWGENLVLRILDRRKGLVPLDALGLDAASLHRLRLMIARPEGIILVTGPTGSGKTTTLYSILAQLNTTDVNIMTLEDPVEYPLPQVRQTAINDAAGIGFANGIRSLMRQDPDVILVGEIRDRDTADMAFRAAMTGHQVYTTLHAGSALGVIPRLFDIGIQPDVLAGNIIGIVAQRLVRNLCPHCREAYVADAFERQLLAHADAAPLTLYRARGCAACAGQGYKGRSAIMEVLKINAELDALIARRATLHELREAAVRLGVSTLAELACQRVLAGETSLEEIARVVDLTDRVSAWQVAA